MSILVVGSVAIDSLETPFGSAKNVLGGAATYFSLVASLYAPVNLVAAVGSDFPREHVDLLRGRGIDLEGLQVRDGKTFHWAGRYSFDLNTAETLDTQLNVFAEFRPSLPEKYRRSECVFLANIDPDLQYEVLKQVPNARLTAMDTMNFWIEHKRDSLTRTLSAVDVVLINEAEARQYADTHSLVTAAKRIQALGPQVVVVKKGEYGCVMFTPTSYFAVPAYPLEEVRDPTGAGDTFAGGFMGYLAAVGDLSPESVRQAVVHGSIVASFTVEDFGVSRLCRLDRQQIVQRYRQLREYTAFEDDRCWEGVC